MRFVIARALLVALVSTFVVPSAAQSPSREDAYRANNLGVALMEQFKYKEGAEAFRRALKADPKLALARTNLAIALYNVPDLAAAEREARAALELEPDAPRPHYVIGLVARTQNEPEKAVAAFKKVLAADPADVGANVNLGQIYVQQKQLDEAVKVFRAALEAEPYNITAAYNLATALMRTGARDEGQQMLKRFQELRASGVGTSIGPNYLEQGRYAEAVASTGLEPGLVDRATPPVAFVDATEKMLPERRDTAPPAAPGAATEVATGATLFDFDGDGDLDLYYHTTGRQALLRNDAGALADVTKGAGIPQAVVNTLGAVAGDYDNDGLVDLYAFGTEGHALYRNAGGGKFSDVTAAAKLPAPGSISSAAAFVDFDHDGDVDIFRAGAARKGPEGGNPAGGANALWRNNGDGTFSDVSKEAGVAVPTVAGMVVPADFDNRRDVDLLVVDAVDHPRLYRNLRNSTFEDVARAVGLEKVGRRFSVAAGDVNKDGFVDFYFGGRDDAGVLATSSGTATFTVSPFPGSFRGASRALFLDYDNDGYPDLLVHSLDGLRLFRNVGDGWTDVTAKALSGAPPRGEGQGSVLLAGDLDRDGDTDVVVDGAGGGLRILRNDGGNANRSITVDLKGLVSNRAGIGARVQVRAGSLLVPFDCYSASPAPAPSDVVIGIGRRQAPDAVRVLWPSGTVQAETTIPAATAKSAATLEVTELDRKPSSCPFLYVWNGERFEFVTDFMGGGEMGYWHAPGVWSSPDPDEYVRIPPGLLVEKDGRYELRVTNELEEALFVDRLQLVAVDHPEGVEVYPDEGLRAAPPAFRLFEVRDARPVARAVDGEARDWTESVASLDRDFVKGFELSKIRGYAGEHALTLDLGPETGGRTLLLLTGWTDYAFSSDNVAAHQAGMALAPPVVQARDASGAWVTVEADLGIPVGRPQTLVVDLTDRLPEGSREVRVVTNMRVYWDRVLVADGAEASDVRLTRLDAERADLRWRGYSRQWAPDGVEPWTYDYHDVSAASPWKVLAGRYTREGDVREPLAAEDDMFVVARTGDEVALSFDARALPPLPGGWTRTFLLYAYGYSKEMDPNSASPHAVEPLPFRGMSGYPYGPGEAYPLTPERQRYLERYNTRVVASPVPAIEAAVEAAP